MFYEVTAQSLLSGITNCHMLKKRTSLTGIPELFLRITVY